MQTLIPAIEKIINNTRLYDESLLTDSSKAATEIIKLFEKEGWVKEQKNKIEVEY